MTDIDIPIHTKIKPAQHPATIKGTSQGAKSARHAMTALYKSEGQIRDLHAVVHNKAIVNQKQFMANLPRPEKPGARKIAAPLAFDSAAASHVIDVGTPIATSALKIADVAIAAIEEQVTRLDSEINMKVLAGKSSRGEELRAYASRLPQPFIDLGKFFQSADKNAALVAAILEAEPYLSNLSAENQNLLRTMASSVLAPDQVSARAETAAALGQLTAASKAFVDSTATIFNGLRSPEADAINSIVKGAS